MSDKGITLEGLAAAVDALRQELATWKALARKQDTLTAAQITATQSGATAAKIDQIAVNTAAIQALSAQVAGQISLEYVTTLPATGEPFTLYLVPQGDGTAPNYCNEYLWVNGDWELIGTTGSMANNGELTIQVNGVAVGTFTANQAANSAINITVPTNTNQLVNGAQYVDAASLATALALKQNNLNAAQLDAVNSGITAALVTQIGTNTTAIAGKQDALTTAQQAAVDSGATAAKIDQIATNAAAIVSLTSSKQDTLSTAQLAAVNSGITSAAVQQISTNTTDIATKAADSAVVHLAGAETIPGDKTFTGSNTFTSDLPVSGATKKFLVVQNTSDDWVLGSATPSSTKELGGLGYRDKNDGTVFWCITFHDTSGDVYTRFNMRWKYANGAKSTSGSNVNTTFELGLDNTGNKYVSTNGSWKTSLTPYTSATYDLGSSSYQWASVYAQTYYYNGTQWGLDKANTWTDSQTFRKTLIIKNSVAVPASSYDIGINFFDSAGNRYGYIQPYVTSDNQKRLMFGSDTGELCCNSDLIPSNNTLNCGNSSYKWKTLNGINPGALSLPNVNAVTGSGNTQLQDISGDLVQDQYFNCYFTPRMDGWAYIALDCSGASIRSGYSSYTVSVKTARTFANAIYTQSFTKSENAWSYIQILFPVTANKEITLEFTFTGFSVTKAYVIPALGNV